MLASLVEAKATSYKWSLFSDAQITAALGFATAAIESYCQRTFAATVYGEWIFAAGAVRMAESAAPGDWAAIYDREYLRNPNSISVKNYPIVALRRVCTRTYTAGSISNNNSGVVDSAISIHNGTLLLTTVGGAADGTASIALASYKTMALLATPIAAAGWILSITREARPCELQIMSGATSGTPSASLALTAPGPSESVRDFDPGAGIIRGPFTDWVFVEYQGGYSTIPADLKEACIACAATYLMGTQHDTSMAGEKIGDYSYTVREPLRGETTADNVFLGVNLQDWLHVLRRYKRLSLDMANPGPGAGQ